MSPPDDWYWKASWEEDSCVPALPMKAALGPAVGNAAPTAAPAAKTIEQQYVKKTQLEHILLRPDSYSA